MTKHLRGAPSGTCEACGKHVARLELDHRDPLWNGGPNDRANLQWLCPTCHRAKTVAERRSVAYRHRRTIRPSVPEERRGCVSRLVRIVFWLFVVILAIAVIAVIV